MRYREKIEQAERGINEINMTPLIDVSLVLVLILLLATPLGFESSIGVRRSQGSARAAEVKEKGERIEIRIVSENDVQVNQVLVPREGLEDALRPLLAESAPRRVVVECADKVSHGAFVNVLDQAKLCGAADIAIAEKR